jgi:hypothetical protein
VDTGMRRHDDVGTVGESMISWLGIIDLARGTQRSSMEISIAAACVTVSGFF